MRAPSLLLILALGLAAPAGAQQPAKPAADRALPSPPAMPTPTPSALLAPLSPQGADAPRCRSTCASSYYFCLSTDAPEDCGANWMQCRNACDAPSRRQVITSLPTRP